MPDDVKLISRTLVNTLLGDMKFLEAFPEFSQVAGALRLSLSPSRSGGCSSCKKRRVEYVAFTDFLNVLKSLPPERLSSVKQRVGASVLAYSVQDTRTGRYVNGKL